MIKSFKDLEVWNLAIDFAVKIYSFTNTLPTEETYSLSSQLRRAAVSVPSNIAEGQKRGNPKEFKRFIFIAKGSLAELITQLTICNRIGYLSDEETQKAINQCEVLDMKLHNLIKSLPEKFNNKHDKNAKS